MKTSILILSWSCFISLSLCGCHNSEIILNQVPQVSINISSGSDANNLKDEPTLEKSAPEIVSLFADQVNRVRQKWEDKYGYGPIKGNWLKCFISDTNGDASPEMILTAVYYGSVEISLYTIVDNKVILLDELKLTGKETGGTYRISYDEEATYFTLYYESFISDTKIAKEWCVGNCFENTNFLYSDKLSLADERRYFKEGEKIAISEEEYFQTIQGILIDGERVYLSQKPKFGFHSENSIYETVENYVCSEYDLFVKRRSV